MVADIVGCAVTPLHLEEKRGNKGHFDVAPVKFTCAVSVTIPTASHYPYPALKKRLVISPFTSTTIQGHSDVRQQSLLFVKDKNSRRPWVHR
jgi:hypothetical protein